MLTDVDELVDRLRSAGARIAVRTEGTPRPLPAGVELVAFRVVQEALTNVVRHTRSAAADVIVVYGDDELQVEVSDEGPGTDADAGRRRPGDDVVGGTGHGLLGMKERVDSVGGAFAAGPAPGGGWRVRARLPLTRLEAS
jgi:signal transduction histidine kinase